MNKLFIPLFSIIYIFLSICFSSCKKDPINREIHTDTIIIGNIAPNYTGVSTTSIKLYVNKLYVDLLGREATQIELTNDVNTLINNNLSESSRESVIQNLFVDSAFYSRIFEITSSDFTNGIGTQEISDEIEFLQYQAEFDSLNGNTQFLFYYYLEINRLSSVLNITNELQANSININEYYKRFLDNYFYDQVNMGTENFVKGAYDDLFKRSPTISELDESVQMVDGAPANIFLADGSNKGDFMNIVTSCNEFYEGYVRKMYLQFLLREPNSQEMTIGVQTFKPNSNYKLIQLQLLKSSEYAGF